MSANTSAGMRDDLATCSGRLVVSHATPGASMDVDLTVLQPGAWGTEQAPWAGDLGAQRGARHCRRRTADATLRAAWQACLRGATW